MKPLQPQGNENAERAFLEGRTEEAALLWKAALADPRCENEGAIEFNLGLAAARIGHQAEALWHFRRAELRLPEQASITEQRARTEEALGQSPDSPAMPLGISSAWALLVLAALFETAGVVLLCSRRTGNKRRWLLIVLTTLLGLGSGAHVLADGAQRAERVAVVVDAADLHGEPTLSAPALERLKAGTTVRVVACTDRWVHIVTARGSGFVPRDKLGIVD